MAAKKWVKEPFRGPGSEELTTVNLKYVILPAMLLAFAGGISSRGEVLRYHTVVLDAQDKIIPWYTPVTNAFDHYLDQCWGWAVAAPNDVHGLPISFLYCAWSPGNPPTVSPSWENDVGEKIPTWVESARLYYQYSGDESPLNLVKQFVDYSLEHGQTPTNHVWPDFPVGTSNAGDTEFRGFTSVWSLWDCHVDLAADIGFAMFRMFQLYGDQKYLDKAVHVADLLESRMVAGTANNSPWPYVVNSATGANRSRYAASWDGALLLFDLLIENNQGNVSNYINARDSLKNWLLTYPMQNGNWVDGHSDNKIDGTDNWSATCASDMCLYLLTHPGWDPNFMINVPRLLQWTEDNFVNVTTRDGLPGQYYGAYVPAEQTAFMYRMGYQATRLGAQYALWYEVTGDETYKDRAYRCFAYNTYLMQNSGQGADGPSSTAGYWWSDCYGEGPRMYYYGMAAVPEWAPPGENHLLRSSSVVTSINYTSNSVSYLIFDEGSTATLRLNFTPQSVLINGNALPERLDLGEPGWVFTPSNGVLRLQHDSGTHVHISAEPPPARVCAATANSDFESGFTPDGGGLIANGWTEWETSPGAALGYDELVIVHAGEHAQRIHVAGGAVNTAGGIFQQIPVNVGQCYTVSIWTFSGYSGTACSLGVDPTGGTNANTGVTWSSANSNATWIEKTWSGIALADAITVYCRASSSDGNPGEGYFDEATPAAAKVAPPLRILWDGNLLTLEWPECPNAQLQYTDQATDPMSWSPVTNSVSIAGGQKAVTLSPTQDAGFFRLVLE